MGNAQNYSIKIIGIETNATKDLTSQEVKSLHESNSDTNEYDDTEKALIDGIPYTTWSTPTLLNSWVNYSITPGYAHTGYIKDENGTVFIRGFIKSGTIGTTVFTLPVGYRPSQRILRSVMCNTNNGRLDIYNNGAVVPTGGTNGWFSLEISFKAEI